MGARGQSSREVGSYTRREGPVAQLVEQGTFNPKVVGSTPTRPTKENSRSDMKYGLTFYFSDSRDTQA